MKNLEIIIVGKRLNNSNRIENIQGRIKRSIDSLVNLRLLKETGQVKEHKRIWLGINLFAILVVAI